MLLQLLQLLQLPGHGRTGWDTKGLAIDLDIAEKAKRLL